MSKVYLAVPIIANRDLSLAQILLQTIEKMGFKVISKWVARSDPGFTITPREIFMRDTKGVNKCDILVADISHGSHGVGMELMLAHMKRKKIICLFSEGAVISRMIRGLPEAVLIEYCSSKDMVKRLKETLGS